MKQILQSLETGVITREEVPAPLAGAGHLLIRTERSLVSAGTERMLVEFGRASWVEKARSQPDKVKQVLDKVKTDGLVSTYQAVRSKLDQPLALGYCNVGVVAEVGANVAGFEVGDRVVSNGKHAEVVSVPSNLCARVPPGVSADAAAFTVLAAIGLQGIRLVCPTLGECVVVTGLGLIGLLSVQMLRAHGCRVLGLDFDAGRLELARSFGAETLDLSATADPVGAARAFSRERGVDAVIITASTKSSDPVSQAARMCRKRGRIVLVGVTGLELSRADFYEKELSFQVSCSYGPGRYDPEYEEGGHDYPVGFVRWTAQRNFEAVLDLMASGAMDAQKLVTHRFQLDRAEAAYALLAGDEPSLGILLEYEPQDGMPESGSSRLTARTVPFATSLPGGARPSVGFIGTGSYAGRVLIPAFKSAGAGLHTAVSSSGVSAVHYGRKHGFVQAATDAERLIDSAEIDTVVVATRHASHAQFALRALRAGKHVFVEKPLCLDLADLAEIEAEIAARPRQCLMVGFNRRFAPHVVKMKELLTPLTEPKAFVMTVNAGHVPAEHWTQDPASGGGRIVGEACHYVDLLRHLAGSPIAEHSIAALGGAAGSQSTGVQPDKAVLSLRFEDGSLGTIHYLANGHKGFPKEHLTVFCAGRVLELDNFRKLRGWGFAGFSRMYLLQQDKGQSACARAFVEAVRAGGKAPIEGRELIEVSRVSIEAQRAVGR